MSVNKERISKTCVYLGVTFCGRKENIWKDVYGMRMNYVCLKGAA